MKAPNLKSKSHRRMLPPSRNAYIVPVQGHRGLSLGYRVNDDSTTWIARRFNNGKYEFHFIGLTDDGCISDNTRMFSFDEAIAKAVEWFGEVSELERHNTPTDARYTVKEAVLDYITDKENEKRKKLNRDRATANAHIIPALGDIELKNLTHAKVKGWRDALAKAKPRKRTRKGKEQAFRATAGHPEHDPDYLRKRHASVNRVLTVLKAALNWSLQEKRQFIRSDNAWKHVKPFPKADAPKVRFLSDDELKQFIPACETPEFADLCKGALVTGARYGELSRLLVENFNEADANIFIAESKNDEARHVFLNTDAVKLFKGFCEGKGPKEHIFLKPDKTAWKTSEQFRPMVATCKQAKVKGVTFHILRHTYASHALMAGMRLEVLQKQLGHKDIRITIRHYGHLCESYRQQQVEQFAPSYQFDEMPTEIEAAPLQG